MGSIASLAIPHPGQPFPNLPYLTSPPLLLSLGRVTRDPRSVHTASTIATSRCSVAFRIFTPSCLRFTFTTSSEALPEYITSSLKSWLFVSLRPCIHQSTLLLDPYCIYNHHALHLPINKKISLTCLLLPLDRPPLPRLPLPHDQPPPRPLHHQVRPPPPLRQ